MGISKEKRKEKLINNFEIIKDNYDKNANSLRTVVVKMLKIDVNIAIEMWSYLILKHGSKLTSENTLMGSIMYNGEREIGIDEMLNIVLDNQVLKNALFSESHDFDLYIDDVIRCLINKQDLQTADELLSLVYNNKHKENTWYEIMDSIIPEYSGELEITEEAYELLEMWSDKIKDKEDRAKLDIKLMEFIE